MKVGILNNVYSHLFPVPKHLFSKDYFAVYNNTLWENLPLLPGQKIWRTLYKKDERRKIHIHTNLPVAMWQSQVCFINKPNEFRL